MGREKLVKKGEKGPQEKKSRWTGQSLKSRVG